MGRRARDAAGIFLHQLETAMNYREFKAEIERDRSHVIKCARRAAQRAAQRPGPVVELQSFRMVPEDLLALAARLNHVSLADYKRARAARRY